MSYVLYARIAVEEWINSTLPIHSMRDHPNHCYAFNGGLWGATKNAIPNLEGKLKEWSTKSGYMQDMRFLASLWDSVKDITFQHDRYSS